MGPNTKAFAGTLSTALQLIKALEGKNLGIIEDELAFALGKDSPGRYSIGYWRRGHIPSDPNEVYALAQVLVERKGLDLRTCTKFLAYADYPDPEHEARIICNHVTTDRHEIRASRMGKSKPSQNLSPFIVGPPVEHPSQFFGRQQTLKQIFATLDRIPLQHIAIIGPRRSGKSSLLKHLQNICYTPAQKLREGQKNNWLSNPKSFQWIMIDFHDPRTHKMSRLLSMMLEQVGISAIENCDLDQFMDLFIPVLDRPTVVLMDEIGTALSASDLPVQLWWSLRSLVNSFANGNLAFMITSQREPAEIAIEKGKSSPFFNIFRIQELGTFSREDILSYINSLPFDIGPAEIEEIIEKSEGWPMQVQSLCQRIWMQNFDNKTDGFEPDIFK